MRAREYLREAMEWSRPTVWEQRRSWIKMLPAYPHAAEAEADDGTIELTDESAALVERMVAGPGEVIPRLAAALARTR